MTEIIDGKNVKYLVYEAYDYIENKIKMFTFSPDKNLKELYFYHI